MNSLLWWLVKDEFNRRELGFEAQLLSLKRALDGCEPAIEKLMKENEELEKKIVGLEAVIVYAKDLHEQMFGIIKSFAPRQYPDSALTQVGGAKSWQSIQKALEKRSAKE